MTELQDPQPEARTAGRKEDDGAHAPTPKTTRAHTPGPHSREVRGLKIGMRVGLILLILIVGFGIFGVLKSMKQEPQTRSEAIPLLTVQGIESRPRPTDRVWEGFGTVGSMRRASVAAEVTARVIDRPTKIEPGRRVRAGDLLVELDPTDYQNQLAAATQRAESLRAQIQGLSVEQERLGTQLDLVGEEIEAARRDLDRTKEAVAQGAGSAGEVDAKLAALRRSEREADRLRQTLELIPSRELSLQAQLTGAQADRALAEQNLVRTRVASPIEGELQSVGPREGDWIVAGSPVAQIVDLARVEVPLKLPVSSSSWVKVGDSVQIWLGDATEQAAHTGRITRFAPEADAASRTVTVFVEVEQDPDRGDRLLPGSFVLGRVRTPDTVERVVVPRRAVRSGQVVLLGPLEEGGRLVSMHRVRPAYSIDGRIPELDAIENEWVALEHGSEPTLGAVVALTTLDQLRPGMRVYLVGDPRPEPDPEAKPEADTENGSDAETDGEG